MIVVIGAMEEEVKAVLDRVEKYEIALNDPFKIYKTQIGQQDVLVCQSGIGKVNAAMLTTFLIQTYPVKLIMNVGSAGGLKEGQAVKDMVIATNCIYHDLIFDFAHPETSLQRATFSVDQTYLPHVSRVLETLQIPAWQGTIVSGDQFISDPHQIQQIVDRFPDAVAVEMESCAIAHVCDTFSIPAIILRSISDLVIKEGNEMDFDVYLPQAAKQSAGVCIQLIESLNHA